MDIHEALEKIQSDPELAKSSAEDPEGTLSAVGVDASSSKQDGIRVKTHIKAGPPGSLWSD